MKKDAKKYVHVGLVLDASGSMSGLKNSTISMMKNLFSSVSSTESKVIIDLWQFDNEVKHLIDGEDVSSGAPKAIEGYEIGGCTALYDAIGIGINSLGQKFAAMDENDRPDAVVFAILTDGFENASREFTKDMIKEKIEHQREKYSWQFQFLAANQDSIFSGSDMGFAARECVDFDASEDGIKGAGMSMCYCICDAIDNGSRRDRERLKKVRMKKKEKINNAHFDDYDEPIPDDFDLDLYDGKTE